ncbi:BTAD domain-containing putative transcriptional regulator [Spirillospora sp. NPDC052269]
MTAELEFRLFGPLEAVAAGRGALDLGTRKQRALVAMLALEPGRVVSLDRLIDELWAGEPPAGATRTLQAYIAPLRKTLEPDRPPRTPPKVLLTREPGYLLAVPPGRIDLWRFTAEAEDGRAALARGEHRQAAETLERALGLWRGEPLGEFAEEEFARPVVTRLTETRTAALENLYDARLALGDDASLVGGLEDLAESEPYRERAWSLLVLALYRAGRQADALAALRRVRTRLADDLGLSPGPELRTLEKAVLDQSPGLLLPAPAPVEATPAEPEPEPEDDRLIARGDQLAQVERRLGAARRGQGGIVLVTGEAGIGKTRLVRAATDLAAARGFRVAWGRCVDGTAPAFWPWAEVLRDAGDASGVLSGDGSGRPQDPGSALIGLYERVMDVLQADGSPLAIVLDDLHWADVSSLRLLDFVAGAAGRRPLLLLVTCRPEPGDHPGALRDTLAALARLGDRLDLAPFSADDVASYLRARRLPDPPGTVATLVERTGGNPFYLGEVLRLRKDDDVPRSVRDVLEHRLARLPEETGTLLRAAAVAGRDIDVDLLEAVTGTTAEQVMDGLEPAVATGLLAEPPSGPDYRFAHALVQQALYTGLGRAERSRLHLRVGEALEPVLPGSESATLAHHFAKAGRLGGADKAVGYAGRAARHATAQLAFTEAVELWRLALDSLPPGRDAERARLLVERGQANRTAGRPEDARRDWEEAIRLALELGDREVLVPAVTAIGGPALWNWRAYGVVDRDMVAVIEDLLGGPLADADRAALLGALALELHYGPRSAEGEGHAAGAVALARGLGDGPLLARTMNNYLLAAFRPGRNTERRLMAEELANLPGRPAGDEVLARVFLMSCQLRDGDLHAWDRELARCEALLDAAPSPQLKSMVRSALIARATLDGRWDEAETMVDRHEMLYGSTLWGGPFCRLVAVYTCRRAQGRAAEVLDELVEAASGTRLVPLRPLAVLAAVESGRPDLARDLIRRWGADVPDDWVGDFLLPVWGLVAARLHDPEKGVPDPAVPDPRVLYDRLVPYAEQFVVAGMGSACWGSTHLVLAELARSMGDEDTAQAHARASLRTHERLGLTYRESESRALL